MVVWCRGGVIVVVLVRIVRYNHQYFVLNFSENNHTVNNRLK